jgi:hypothetical protein
MAGISKPVIASGAKQSSATSKSWIASSRSLSSGAHLRDPLAPRNDERKRPGLFPAFASFSVMPGLVPGIHVLLSKKVVDGRVICAKTRFAL